MSTGKPGYSTPGGEYNIIGQLWRHDSTKYPSKANSENNMDHVSYFKPAYGFHATAFGLYSMLGKKDSHGCIRMARPEARAIYRLIKSNRATTTVFSFNGKEDPNDSEVDLIRTQLAKDLNFIQSTLLRRKNRGDVVLNESKYLDLMEKVDNSRLGYYQLSRDEAKTYNSLTEIPHAQDLGPFSSLQVVTEL